VRACVRAWVGGWVLPAVESPPLRACVCACVGGRVGGGWTVFSKDVPFAMLCCSRARTLGTPPGSPFAAAWDIDSAHRRVRAPCTQAARARVGPITAWYRPRHSPCARVVLAPAHRCVAPPCCTRALSWWWWHVPAAPVGLLRLPRPRSGLWARVHRDHHHVQSCYPGAVGGAGAGGHTGRTPHRRHPVQRAGLRGGEGFQVGGGARRTGGQTWGPVMGGDRRAGWGACSRHGVD
jgi:hypothetical protein